MDLAPTRPGLEGVGFEATRLLRGRKLCGIVGSPALAQQGVAKGVDVRQFLLESEAVEAPIALPRCIVGSANGGSDIKARSGFFYG